MLHSTVETDRRLPLKDRFGMYACVVLGMLMACVLAYGLYHLFTR